jgi:hypothetical protein
VKKTWRPRRPRGRPVPKKVVVKLTAEQVGFLIEDMEAGLDSIEQAGESYEGEKEIVCAVLSALRAVAQ